MTEPLPRFHTFIDLAAIRERAWLLDKGVDDGPGVTDDLLGLCAEVERLRAENVALSENLRHRSYTFDAREESLRAALGDAEAALGEDP